VSRNALAAELDLAFAWSLRAAWERGEISVCDAHRAIEDRYTVSDRVARRIRSEVGLVCGPGRAGKKFGAADENAVARNAEARQGAPRRQKPPIIEGDSGRIGLEGMIDTGGHVVDHEQHKRLRALSRLPVPLVRLTGAVYGPGDRFRRSSWALTPAGFAAAGVTSQT
jgi:hypothetical protein